MTFYLFSCRLVSPLIQVACVVTKLGVGREEMCCSHLLQLQLQLQFTVAVTVTVAVTLQLVN